MVQSYYPNDVPCKCGARWLEKGQEAVESFPTLAKSWL